MAVFTPLTDTALQQIADAYGISGSLGFSGIADGIENSSFLIDRKDSHGLTKPEWVLTIVEELGSREVEFVCAHLQRLSDAGVAVAAPINGVEPHRKQYIAGKPALLFPFLDGQHIEQANAEHCRQVGHELARAHCITSTEQQECSHGWEWLQGAAVELRESMNVAQRDLLDAELAAQADWQKKYAELPEAVIHADLFRDNVLFADGRLSGLIDWYSACTGPALYDIAIALNDWCRNQADQLDEKLCEAFLGGYTDVRPLQPAELRGLSLAKRRAALRFWLSRLQATARKQKLDRNNAEKAQILCKSKDPSEFERLLIWLRANH